MSQGIASEVAVVGWSAFVPGFADLAGWLAARPSAEHEKPEGRLVPLRDRRRASLLSRGFADVFLAAVERAGFEPGRVASVFGSAIGEASTMIGLLDQMWSGAATLSPMKFATSVHNAASGLISIATANRGFTTSLGADYDTPAMALLEGVGMVRSEGRAVVVCCGDEAPPEHLVPAGTGWSLLCVALALAPVGSAPPGSPRLVGPVLAPSTSTPSAPSTADGRIASSMSGTLAPPLITAPTRAGAETLARNPNVGLFDLAVALERGQRGLVRLDRGAGRGFVVRIDAADATALWMRMSAWPPIAQLLPHGEAVIELEELIDWAPGRAVCSMRVDERSRYVEDGALETVLLLEAMAQAVAACLGYEAYRGGVKAGVGMVVACRALRAFVPRVAVGTRLELRVERVRGNEATSHFECWVERAGEGATVATATLTLVHGAAVAP